MDAMKKAMDLIAELANEPLRYLTPENFSLTALAKSDFAKGLHMDTLIITWIIMLVVLIFCVCVSKRFSAAPGKIQVAFEFLYSFFDNLADGLGGKRVKKYLPWVVSFFIFITISNLWGLLPAFKIEGWHLVLSMPPTRDISTTLALAILSFCSFQIIGYKEGGVKYLLHYFHPLPSILPGFPTPIRWIIAPPLAVFFIILNLVEEIARVVSLTMRLMGNILGEHIVMGIMIGLIYVAYALAPDAFVSFLFGLGVNIFPFALLFMGVLTGVVQGFVFTILTLSYIGSAINFEEE